jgi:5-methylcytosine-specific restriction endonuclease McrA
MSNQNLTPRHRIKGMLRQIWLRSAERGAALKRDNYSCQICGVKQSKAKGKEQKVEVHHKKGIDVWDKIIDLIYEHLLCDVDDLQTLCPDCHDKQI